MRELYVIVYVSITLDLDVLRYVQYFLNVIELHDYMVSETSEESIPRLMNQDNFTCFWAAVTSAGGGGGVTARMGSVTRMCV